MSIIVDEKIRLIIQGITGKTGSEHARRMLEYNVDVIGGVTPGRGGETVYGRPVYNTVLEAKRAHREINASLILVPVPSVKSAVYEAVQAKIRTVVVSTEWVPIKDTLDMVTFARNNGTMIIGPNTMGVISPGKAKIGMMPDNIYGRGHIGLISRSGTLAHENASNLTYAGFGLSTCIGIGGDPIIGLNHKEALELFRDDPDTKLIVLIGEVGGAGEELAAHYIKDTYYPKPVIAFIAGRYAPAGKKMGHAGAIVSNGTGSIDAKVRALSDAGVKVASTVGEVVRLVEKEDAKLGGALSTLERKSDYQD